MNKFLSLLVAAIVLGAASIASARTVTKYRVPAVAHTATTESFQGNWNISY
jgi:hypothetical protein